MRLSMTSDIHILVLTHSECLCGCNEGSYKCIWQASILKRFNRPGLNEVYIPEGHTSHK